MRQLRLAFAIVALVCTGLLAGCFPSLPKRTSAVSSRASTPPHWALLFEQPDGVYLQDGVDGKARQLWTHTEEGRVVSWDLAPDGKHVAYATAEGDGAVKPLPDGAASPLYEKSVNAGACDWSPDSRTLAYVEDGALHLWREGQRSVLVAKCGLTDLAWSPDGKQIAYGRRAEDDKDLGLWIVSAAGGEPKRLVKGTGDVFGAGNISWSPDGQWIAFLHSWEGGALCFIRPDGTGYREDIGPAWLPLLWLPDGSAVVYAALEDEITSRGLWRCSPSGKPEAIVPSGTSSFDMATNGKLLVLTSPRESATDKTVTVRVLAAPRAQATSSATQKFTGRFANGMLTADGALAAAWVEGEDTTGTIWLGAAGKPLTTQITGVSQLLGWVKQ